MMTAAQILRAEAQVFTDFPDVHCKGRYAKNKDGKGVEVEGSGASKFCAYGFLRRAAQQVFCGHLHVVEEKL